MDTKICGKCRQEKLITEFYKHKRDGYQSRCKQCKREDSKLLNRQPQRKVYNRRFYEKLKDEGYFDEYNQRPMVKARKAKQQSEYSRNPRLRIKYLARWYAKRMTANGTIEQQPCAFCGSEKSQRHHPDYNQPLLIVWLCANCHRELHNKAKAEGVKRLH